MSRFGTLVLVCLMAVAGCGEDTASDGGAAPRADETVVPITEETVMAAKDPENAIVIQLDGGNVVIDLAPDLAPKHVERIKELARSGFYDGIVFHRVIEGFMAQTGDPTGTGTGGSDKPDLPAEFTREASFERGTVGMARSSNPNSANSQFFICLEAAPHLDGQYTIIGKVAEGMEHVDAIKKGAPGSGTVTDPDRMIAMKVAADAT